MLVLSRNEGDSVTFPELDMAIEILKIKGNRVQLGISAPEQIRALRTELLKRINALANDLCPEEQHALRNRLNTIGLALSISQKHLDRGDLRRAQMAIDQLYVAGHVEAEDAASRPVEQPAMTVLLVEDNPNERQLLADILSMNRIEVHVAKNGQEAIEVLKKVTPDAILIDMEMPVCDGPTAIREIRREQRYLKLPIYAVTGVSQADATAELPEGLAVDGWFQKPCQSQSLLDTLGTLANRCLAS